MRGIVLIIALASLIQIDAEDSTGTVVNRAIDKMLERVLQALPLHQAELDATTLGKSGHLAVPSSTKLAGINPAVSRGVAMPFQLRHTGQPGISSSGLEPVRRGDLTVPQGKKRENLAIKFRVYNKRPKQADIPSPPVDPDNEEFVIFVRSKKLPIWTPATLIKGTAAANQLVKSLSDENSLQKDTLIRSIGESVYSNAKDLMKAAKRSSKALQFATEVEFGFKIRDKNNPKEWYFPKDIIILPPEDQLPKAPLDGVGKAFDNVKESVSNLFGTGDKK